MPDNLTRTFGYLIAFVCPGFILLWGASFVDKGITKFLGVAATGATSAGAAVLVGLASLALGVFVSGIRSVVLDRWLMPLLKMPKAPENVTSYRKVPEVANQLEGFKQDHYRFYQFHGNTLLAVTLSSFAWLFSGTGLGVLDLAWRFVLFALGVAGMGAAAYRELFNYRTKAVRLLDELPLKAEA